MDSNQLYKLAYNAHYQEQNYKKALENYNKVIKLFPDSAEAGYAKSQLGNLEKDKDKFIEESEVKQIIKMDESRVILTTAPILEGYKVVETLEIITAECVLGIDIFSDLFTSITDVFGGRSKTTQNSLRDGRKICLNELKREAFELGANAVIAVDLKYSEFSGKGKSMLFVVASGTAVIAEKNQEQKDINDDHQI